MMLKLDPDNPLSTPVQTRDGRKARIVCVDAAGKRPLIALTVRPDGSEMAQRYRPCGRYGDKLDTRLDLINIPERRTVEVGATLSPVLTVAISNGIPGEPYNNLRLTFDNDRLIAAEVIG